MLIEFRVENHRSILDEQVLSLEAGRTGAPDDPRPRAVQGYPSARLLPAAALYGANASGKSNVLHALSQMRKTVISSHRKWSPEGGVHREPFAWGEGPSRPTMMEVILLDESVRYQYGFVADDERFLEEWLYAWPTGRKQRWFEREGDRYKFGEHLQGENKLIQKVTRPNALFLSAAAQHGHRQLHPVFAWFVAIKTVIASSRIVSSWGLDWLSRRLKDAARVGEQSTTAAEERHVTTVTTTRIVELLRAADVGIVDFKLVEPAREQEQGPASPWSRLHRDRILVRHQSSDEDAWLPLEAESQGTLTLLRMVPQLVHTLSGGGVLVVDELEASLHPLLAIQLLRLFNDPQINTYNAQIIFTTHDTNLLGNVLGESPLRRDQIWLTEKNPEGKTCLYPLTDYRPRKAENIERGYLQGRYGAIPLLGNLARHLEMSRGEG